MAQTDHHTALLHDACLMSSMSVVMSMLSFRLARKPDCRSLDSKQREVLQQVSSARKGRARMPLRRLTKRPAKEPAAITSPQAAGPPPDDPKVTSHALKSAEQHVKLCAVPFNDSSSLFVSPAGNAQLYIMCPLQAVQHQHDCSAAPDNAITGRACEALLLATGPQSTRTLAAS